MQNQIRVIYEDKNFLAVYKPAGLLVHQTKISKLPNYPITQLPTLVDWLIKNYPEVKNVGDSPGIRPGIVHRLDKDTSGIILIARNQKYFEYLKNLFATGQIKKTYSALVYGEVKPKTGIIKKAIYLKPGTTKRSVWQGKMEKEAITEYKVLKYFIKTQMNTDKNTDKHGYIRVNRFSHPHESAYTLLSVWPKTGRTHQIRVHLASIQHPVVGDTLYGPKTSPFNLKRLFLHAESLEFSLENGRRMKIESGLPNELNDVLDKIS